MKQLVLYFLFFVCAAFVLVQCARIFPTAKKLPAAKSPSGKVAGKAANQSSHTQPSYSTSNWLRLRSPKKTAFNLYFTEQAFPLNMMKYISHYQFLTHQYWGINENKIETWQLFYNPYTNLTYTELFDKNDGSLIANNPFDRKR